MNAPSIAAGADLAPADATGTRHHPLFRAHPLAGQVRLSTGPAPTPYHVYDGHGVFVAGTADFDAARSLLAREHVAPVRTEQGRALMGLWVFDFTDASLGAHHELQVSLFVSRRPIGPLPAHRLTVIEQMLRRDDVHMLCHGLWNNTPGVVAYNRELLALDARLSASRIERDGRGAFQFAVCDEATRTPVAEGRFERLHRPSLHASLALVSRLGLRRLAALAREPWLRVPVLNPTSERLPRNAAADSFTKSERSVLRYFEPGRDRLAILTGPYRALDFQPQVVQLMEGFRFVYLAPR